MNEAAPTGWAYIPAVQQQHIEAGVKALARIDKKRDFHDWYLVGMALLNLREAAREQSGAESGRIYNQAYAQCITDNPKLRPLADIDDATRSNSVWLAQNWEVVSKWHDELRAHNQRLVNHPAAVRHRYNLEHPQPGAPRTKPDLITAADAPKPEDGENEEEEGEDWLEKEDAEEVFALDGHVPPPATVPVIEPEEEPATEDLIAAFDALWLRMTPDDRAEIVRRILAWQEETVAHAAASDPSDRSILDATMAEANRAVNKRDGAKVRAAARRKAMTVSSGEPTPERTAMAIEEALAKDAADPGGDIWAGIGDDVGPTKH